MNTQTLYESTSNSGHLVDVLAVFDGYDFYMADTGNKPAHDIELEAQSLTGLANSHGHNNQYYCILHENDKDRSVLYRSLGHKMFPMNGNRPNDLLTTVQELVDLVNRLKPRKVIVMGNHEAFGFLCIAASQVNAEVMIWNPGRYLPEKLKLYNHWPLNELVPAVSKEKVGVVWLDIENHLITLDKNGIYVDTHTYLTTIREIARLQGITLKAILAWADWGRLRKTLGRDFQLEFEKSGVKTFYQINLPGKSTSDMAIVGDIHESFVRDPEVSYYIVGTGDADFIPAIEKIKERGKKSLVITLRSSLSSRLAKIADQVIYLDDYLKRRDTQPPSANHILATLLSIAHLLRAHRWQYIYTNHLPSWLSKGWIDETLNAGGLLPRDPGRTDCYVLNPDHPIVKQAVYFEKWFSQRLYSYFHGPKPISYVDTALLVRKIREDNGCMEVGIGPDKGIILKYMDAAVDGHLVIKEAMAHPKDGSTIYAWRLVQPELIQSIPNQEWDKALPKAEGNKERSAKDNSPSQIIPPVFSMPRQSSAV